MIDKTRFPRLACALALPVLLSACATQEALDARVKPLEAGLAELRQQMAGSAGQLNEGVHRDAGFSTRQGELEQRMAKAEAEFERLFGHIRVLEAQVRIDRQAQGARDAAQADDVGQRDRHLAALEGRLAQLAERIAQVSSQARVTAAQVAIDREAHAAREAGHLQEAAAHHLHQVEREAQLADLAARVEAASAQARVTAAQVAIDRQAQADASLATRLARAEAEVAKLSNAVARLAERPSQEEIRLHGKVASKTVLTEDTTLYPLNSPSLGAGDRRKLDALAEQLKAMKGEFHLDIQGHTDNLGTDDYNYELGRARASVVSRYLNLQHGIPLSRMSVVSFGASSPLDPKGRHNRRIAILTLVLEKQPE